MSQANSNSDLERAEHLAYADSKGVKRVSVFNNGVQVNAATEESLVQHLPLSAFGDLRTAELSPVMQFDFAYTVDNTELLTQIKTNGGTITQADGMAVVGTSTTTASVSRLICHQHVKYRAGFGGLMRFTGLFTTGVAGTSQWIGLAGMVGSTSDFLNGYMIGYNGETFGVVRFKNDVTNFTPLSECDDPLDGTGESGIILDPTKLNVFTINYQYLGAGAIKFGIEKPNGDIVVFHTIEYANTETTPSVLNPHFHLTMYVNNKATTSNIIVKSASLSYFVEGKTKFTETQQYNQSTGITTKSSVTTEVALFTIRNKSTYASKPNLISALLERITVGVQTASPQNLAQFRIVEGATLGGTPSFTDISTTDSIVDIDVAGTTVTGGRTVMSGVLAGQNSNTTENLSNYEISLHPGDTITIAVSSANSATLIGSCMWKELF